MRLSFFQGVVRPVADILFDINLRKKNNKQTKKTTIAHTHTQESKNINPNRKQILPKKSTAYSEHPTYMRSYFPVRHNTVMCLCMCFGHLSSKQGIVAWVVGSLLYICLRTPTIFYQVKKAQVKHICVLAPRVFPLLQPIANLCQQPHLFWSQISCPSPTAHTFHLASVCFVGRGGKQKTLFVGDSVFLTPTVALQGVVASVAGVLLNCARTPPHTHTYVHNRHKIPSRKRPSQTLQTLNAHCCFTGRHSVSGGRPAQHLRSGAGYGCGRPDLQQHVPVHRRQHPFTR